MRWDHGQSGCGHVANTTVQEKNYISITDGCLDDCRDSLHHEYQDGEFDLHPDNRDGDCDDHGVVLKARPVRGTSFVASLGWKRAM